MAQRAFNKALINGVAVATKDFVDGSGVIIISGSDTSKVTDDHVMHNLRLNEHYKALFKTFRKRMELETDPATDVSGGTQIFYLDTTVVAEFNGVVAVEYSEKDNTTSIEITGEAIDV